MTPPVKSKRPSVAPPRPSTFPPNRRCPIHGFALSPDGRCVRCGNEGRTTVLRSNGAEPLLAPTPLRTKLMYVLIAVCGLGAVLVFTGRAGQQTPVERGLEAPPGREPPAPPDPAAAALAQARRENEQRDLGAAARRVAEEEEERRRARAGVPVVLYGTTWCGACAQARAYLRAQGIPFTDHDIEANPTARQAHASLNPAHTVPTIEVGGQVLRGFSASSFERALDEETENRLR